MFTNNLFLDSLTLFSVYGYYNSYIKIYKLNDDIKYTNDIKSLENDKINSFDIFNKNYNTKVCLNTQIKGNNDNREFIILNNESILENKYKDNVFKLDYESINNGINISKDLYILDKEMNKINIIVDDTYTKGFINVDSLKTNIYNENNLEYLYLKLIKNKPTFLNPILLNDSYYNLIGEINRNYINLKYITKDSKENWVKIFNNKKSEIIFKRKIYLFTFIALSLKGIIIN